MNIRLPRVALVERLTRSDAPAVTLIEAPTGFGKSWLLRRSAPEEAIRLRGELGPLLDEPLGRRAVVIDDVEQLDGPTLRILVERIEDAPADARLMVAGR